MSGLSDERKFLHDVASPLAAAIFTVETLLEDLRAEPAPPDLKTVERLQGALAQIHQLIQARRSKLIQEMDQETKRAGK
jgi:hypothetical protein